MTREYAIEIIENLYPADAKNPKTAQIGQELLEQAKSEIDGWRVEPTEILIRYAQLCLDREEKICLLLARTGHQMKILYRIYDSPEKDNYIGEILWFSNGLFLIEWGENLLKEDYKAESLSKCFEKIRNRYKSFYLQKII